MLPFFTFFSLSCSFLTSAFVSVLSGCSALPFLRSLFVLFVLLVFSDLASGSSSSRGSVMGLLMPLPEERSFFEPFFLGGSSSSTTFRAAFIEGRWVFL